MRVSFKWIDLTCMFWGWGAEVFGVKSGHDLKVYEGPDKASHSIYFCCTLHYMQWSQHRFLATAET